jgi:hypothetical protein
MTLGKVSRQVELLDDVARFSDEVLPERSTTRSYAGNAISCSRRSVRRPVRGQGRRSVPPLRSSSSWCSSDWNVRQIARVSSAVDNRWRHAAVSVAINEPLDQLRPHHSGQHPWAPAAIRTATCVSNRP